MSTTYGSDHYLNSNEAFVKSFNTPVTVTDNLRNVINNKKIMRGKEFIVPKSSVIETAYPELDSSDWEVADKENNFEMVKKENHLNTSGFDALGSQAQAPVHKELITRLHQCLRKSQEEVLGGRRILLPADMLPRLAKEIMRMSASEPYGIRGVLINIALEQRDKTIALGKVESTSYVAATFVVNITFREDESRWNTIRGLVLGGFLGRNKELYFSPGYKVEKEKLYRSSSPTFT